MRQIVSRLLACHRQTLFTDAIADQWWKNRTHITFPVRTSEQRKCDRDSDITYGNTENGCCFRFQSKRIHYNVSPIRSPMLRINLNIRILPQNLIHFAVCNFITESRATIYRLKFVCKECPKFPIVSKIQIGFPFSSGF